MPSTPAIVSVPSSSALAARDLEHEIRRDLVAAERALRRDARAAIAGEAIPLLQLSRRAPDERVRQHRARLDGRGEIDALRRGARVVNARDAHLEDGPFRDLDGQRRPVALEGGVADRHLRAEIPARVIRRDQHRLQIRRRAPDALADARQRDGLLQVRRRHGLVARVHHFTRGVARAGHDRDGGGLGRAVHPHVGRHGRLEVALRGHPRHDQPRELVAEQGVDRRVGPGGDQRVAQRAGDLRARHDERRRNPFVDRVAQIDWRRVLPGVGGRRRRIAARRDAGLEVAAVDEQLLELVAILLPLVEVERAAFGDPQRLPHLRLADVAEGRDEDVADLFRRALLDRPNRRSSAERDVVADLVRPILVVLLHEAQLQPRDHLPADDVGDLAALAQVLRDDHLEGRQDFLREGQALRRVRVGRDQARIEHQIAGIARLDAHAVEADRAPHRARDLARERRGELLRHDVAGRHRGRARAVDHERGDLILRQGRIGVEPRLDASLDRVEPHRQDVAADGGLRAHVDLGRDAVGIRELEARELDLVLVAAEVELAARRDVGLSEDPDVRRRPLDPQVRAHRHAAVTRVDGNRVVREHLDVQRDRTGACRPLRRRAVDGRFGREKRYQPAGDDERFAVGRLDDRGGAAEREP